MDINEIKAFLESNKDKEDVKAFVASLQAPVTLDTVKNFVSTDAEGIKWFQKETDSKVTKGISTWKENNLQKEVDAKIKELYPEESEADKKLRQLQLDLEAEKNARVRESLKNKALSYATAKGLPTEVIDFFLGQDEETTTANLEKFETVFQASLQQAVEGKFKNNGYKPPASGGGTVFTKEQLASMSADEINKNWDAISKAMADGAL